jgi:hypothetical protein
MSFYKYNYIKMNDKPEYNGMIRIQLNKSPLSLRSAITNQEG